MCTRLLCNAEHISNTKTIQCSTSSAKHSGQTKVKCGGTEHPTSYFQSV